MNMVSQFVLYPTWANLLGREEYGNILFLLSIINIVSVSVGISLNNARLVNSIKEDTVNGEYNIILFFINILLMPICILINYTMSMNMEIRQLFLFWILMCLTMWRYYADVEFRLTTNYKGYFLYYIIISIGYLVGRVLYIRTGIWQWGLILGELAGIIFVFIKGHTIRPHMLEKTINFTHTIKKFVVLLFAQLLSNLIFNMDRIFLKVFFNGSAVTIYYLASLVGKTAALITGPLNSVIIGYLSKYKGKLTRKTIHVIMVILVGIIFIGNFGAVFTSNILIKILYPTEIESVKEFFLEANLAAMFYFCSGIFTTILLRYTPEKCQLYINIIYSISFFITTGIAIYLESFECFVYAILIANGTRFISALLFGLNYAKQNEGI